MRLFEEFYRVNHQYARKFSGSGLGLAIVKQLIGAQGGRVGAFSEGQGKGTTFFFTLPVAKIPKESDKLPPKTHSTHFDLKSLRK